MLDVQIKDARLELHEGDVTKQHVDAIVNAANARLAGGGGVDGAIHRRGGPGILEATRRLFPEGCPTGSAVITTAGELPAKYVIHAVGPVWRGGDQHEADLLADAYSACLGLAVQHECESLAIPALSTGAYHFPLEQAAQIAVRTILEFLTRHGRPKLVRLVLWDDVTLNVFSRVLAQA